MPSVKVLPCAALMMALILLLVDRGRHQVEEESVVSHLGDHRKLGHFKFAGRRVRMTLQFTSLVGPLGFSIASPL